MKTETIKLYEDRDDVTLTAYIWDDSFEMLAGARRPAVLICPGGGYLACSGREAEPVALRFMGMGYHTFVLRYSVYSEGKPGAMPDPSKKVEPKEMCQYPAQIRDVAKAMLKINERAGEWLVDTEQIALCGFSAGAHNVALYATNWDKPVISEFFKEPKEKFRPATVVLGYTLGDFTELLRKADQMSGMDKQILLMSCMILFGTEDPTEEQKRLASPAQLVTESTPPMFIWSTATDEMVPVQQSLRMANALAEKNIPFELHIFKEGQHGLSIATQAAASSRNQINDDVAGWVVHAEKWLKDKIGLKIPEKSAFDKMLEEKNM